MTAVRVLLAVLLAAVIAPAAWAAPAPLPRPDRNRPTEAQLLRRFERMMGFDLVFVTPSSTPGLWVVSPVPGEGPAVVPAGGMRGKGLSSLTRHSFGASLPSAFNDASSSFCPAAISSLLDRAVLGSYPPPTNAWAVGT
jgi:hypothetical protein